MNEDNKTVEKQTKKKAVIDFGKIFKDLLKHKKLYYKVLPVAFILAVVYALAQPNYYTCEVLLSPELSSTNRTSSSLSSLARSFGFNLGKGSAGMGSEALFPTLYPDLVNSTDFKTTLFEVPVTIEGNKEEGEASRTMSYYEYLDKEQKYPWYSKLMPGAIINGVVSLFSKKKEEKKEALDPFRLTKKQAMIIKAINKKVVCDVDKKTMVITISVTDQNPVICAVMADTVKTRLQNFITEYRTSKARVDLEYNRKLYAETKERYEKARQKYAEFTDANQDIILQTVRQKQTDLENEMQLQYNMYTQVAAQMMQAEARVQEDTPAFTTLQSATVPVRKAGPARAKKCLIFLFLAFLGTTAWILYKEDDVKPLLGLG